MLTLTPPGRPLDRRTLTTPGGFCWWYGDVIDADGTGVVVIGAFALPFLERRDVTTVPQARPSLNVAVYERGVCTFYALLEQTGSAPHAAPSANDAVQEACAWEPAVPDRGRGERWRFGESTLGFDSDGVRGRFFADLDVVLPVGTLRGRVTVEGPARQVSGHDLHTLGTPPTVEGQPKAIAHDWSPQLGPSAGEARLVVDGREVVVVGSGYHDRNGALLPLWQQGIDWWLWGRADVDDGTSRIVYALWPQGGGPPAAVGVVTDARGQGRVVDVDIDVGDRHRTWLGMGEVRRFVATERGSGAPFLVGEVAHRIDDGPFYLRHTLRAGVTSASAGTTGFLEVVDVGRIDRPWQRPFVRMRVTPPATSATSLWHPLFAGSRAGRVGRQLRWLTGAKP